MKTAWVDLMAITAAVKRATPSAEIYLLRDKYAGVEYRIGDEHKPQHHRFCINVFANGDVLGAWPCRTSTQRKALRAVLDELDRQARATSAGEG